VKPLFSRLLNYFLRGLVVAAPLVLTGYVCWLIFETIDGWLEWLRLPFPGMGFLIMIALITVVGALASSIATRSLIGLLDGALERLPFVRLLYSSIKDMLNAFVGEKRRFDKPVLVSLSDDRAVKVIAFMTSDSLTALGLADQVSVYMPVSYGFSGHILVVPADRVERIDAEASQVLAFILSGGVTEVSADV
jgi:uncharacterized membrane protein